MKEEEGVEGKEEKREGGDGGGTEEKTKVNDERVEKKPKALEKEEREVKMEGKEMKEEEEDKDVVEKKRKRYLRVSGGKDKDSRCQVRSLHETYLKAFFQHPPNTPTVAAEHHTHNHHHVCSKQHTPQHNLTYYKS
ncbi:hypothetical protein M8J76_008066 [Diaphorina citri]|nr:hypothetical protein M8J76_008066 [Diaphorina citri]